MKDRAVSTLLRIYPAVWRQQYGPEFSDVLKALQFRAGTVANVVWHGVWQRIRVAEPWVLLGLPLMLVTTFFTALMIIAPPAYSPANDFGASASLMTRLVIAFVNLALAMGCGFWTVVRNGGSLPRAGVQTMKFGLLIALPLFISYFSMEFGVLRVFVVGPGDIPTTFAEHGLALAFHSADLQSSELGVHLVVPMFVGLVLALPQLCVLGMLGGELGRFVLSKRLHPA